MYATFVCLVYNHYPLAGTLLFAPQAHSAVFQALDDGVADRVAAAAAGDGDGDGVVCVIFNTHFVALCRCTASSKLSQTHC